MLVPGDIIRLAAGDMVPADVRVLKEVGMPVEHLLLGSQIEAMSDNELAEAVAASSVFARLAPAHKAHHPRAAEPRSRRRLHG
jgi:Mg2+-importing ATPase